MSCHCCRDHSVHNLLFHRRRRWLPLVFWAVLLAGVPGGLAAMLWPPLGPPVFLLALTAEVLWVVRALRRA